MTAFRKFLFWLHLVLGLAAGGVIAVVAFTGAIMAFQPQILAWAERDISRVAPAAPDLPLLSVDQLLTRVREAQPEARPQNVTISSDPSAAVVVSLGRSGLLYVDPFSGTVQSGAKSLRDFFQFTLRVHRWLALDRPAPPQTSEAAKTGATPPATGITGRDVGGSIVGGAAVVFFLLCLSGLYLWWPRAWTARVFKSIAAPNFSLRGKARDWNWHNAFGFWALPALVLMSITGAIMAFRPVSNWIYQRPDIDALLAPKISRPEPGAKPLGSDALFAIAKREFPQWKSITQRTAQRQRAGAATTEQAPRSAENDARSGGEGSATRATSSSSSEISREAVPRPRGPGAVNFTIRENGSSSPVAAQLHLDPYTGAVLQKERFSDYSFRRATRSLVLPVHQGTLGGVAGQIIAFLACISALVLTYTGFSLAWRRFFKRSASSITTPPITVHVSSNSMTESLLRR